MGTTNSWYIDKALYRRDKFTYDDWVIIPKPRFREEHNVNVLIDYIIAEKQSFVAH